LEANLKTLSCWLEENKLSLHLGKTESILFGGKRKINKMSKLSIMCNDVKIDSKTEVKYLGNVLDQHLSGDATCSSTVKRINGCLKFFYRKKCLFGFKEKKMLCSTMLQPVFDYACISWFNGLTKTHKKHLQVCQNKILRFMFCLNTRSRIDCNIFSKVNWLDVQGRVDFLTLNMMYKIYHKTAPQYMCYLEPTRHGYSTRNNVMTFKVPDVKGIGRNYFVFNGIRLWNSLPNSIRSCTSINSFKSRCKRFLFSNLRIREHSDFLFY
jgi:hypothetical protein